MEFGLELLIEPEIQFLEGPARLGMFNVGQCGKDEGLDFKAQGISALAQRLSGLGGAQAKLASIVLVYGPLHKLRLHQSGQDP